MNGFLNPSNLRTDQVEIFYSNFETAAAPKVRPEELKSSAEFAAKRQREFLAGRSFLRSLLSQHFTGVDPLDWRFRQDSNGKPEIEFPRVNPEFKFNISHSDGMLAIGFGMVRALGIDIERIRPTEELVEIAKIAFSPTEFKDLMTNEGDTLTRRFFEYWTVKEAFLKAIGSGFLLSPDQFTFRFENPVIYLANAAARVPLSRENWVFQINSAAPQLVCATAILPFTLARGLRESTQ